jgi:regulatory protein
VNRSKPRPEAASPAALREDALRLLARREHSRAELARKLAARGHAPDVIGSLLDAFEREGKLDERRYAETFIHAQRARFGRARLANELRRRGISDATISSELPAAAGDEEAAALHALWQRRFGQSPQDARARARQIRFLQGRGFSLDAILRLLREPQAL